MNLLLAIVTILSVHAQSSLSSQKSMVLECEPTQSPSTIDDNWGLYILGEEIAFFDNDHYSLGKIIPSHRNENSKLEYIYKNYKNQDPFKVLLGFELYKVTPYKNGKLKTFYRYAELYTEGRHKPDVFICYRSSRKNIEEFFKYARD